MTESPVKHRCPHCRHVLTDPHDVETSEPEAEPMPGAATVCPFCGEAAVFDDNVRLRKVTEAELQDLEQDPRFQILSLVSRRLAKARGTLTADPEGLDDTDPEHGPFEIPLRITAAGDLETGHIPPRLREAIQPLLQDIRTRMVGEDIRDNVTPEIANYVLSAYGNEQASMPSIAVGALISLIRLCKESDDYLLARLDDVEGIHGYVLAVAVLAENPPEGIEALELLA